MTHVVERLGAKGGLVRGTFAAVLMMVLLSAIPATSSNAQRPADFDFTVETKDVVHGRVRTSDVALSSRVWAQVLGAAGEFSIGAAALSELRWGGDSGLSLRGTESRAISNVNSWTEGRLHEGFGELVLGYSRNDYSIRSPASLTSDDRNELYAGIETRHDQPIVSGLRYRARYWHGVGNSATRFGEVTVGHQVLILPLNDFTGAAEFTLGADLSKGEHVAGPFIQFAELRIALVSSMRCDRKSTFFRFFPGIAYHEQWGLVSATQRVAIDRTEPRFGWWEFNVWPLYCSNAK